jgi:mono/diheme cytochrome c family protein
MPNTNNDLERSTNRWMWAGLVLMLIGVVAFPLYRVYEPTARAEAAEANQANLAQAGASLWTSTCASCHGANGAGVDAPALNSLQFLTIASDEQIFSLVNTGVPGTDMAAYGQQFDGPLTRQQIAALTACIRSWEETAPDRPDWRDMVDAPAEEEGDGHGHEEEPDDHGDETTTEGPAPCGPDYDPDAFAPDEPVDESEPHVDEVPHDEEAVVDECDPEDVVDESEPHVDEVPHDEEVVVDESEPHVDEVPHDEEVVVDESEPHVDEVPHDEEVVVDECDPEDVVDESEPHVDEVPHDEEVVVDESEPHVDEVPHP